MDFITLFFHSNMQRIVTKIDKKSITKKFIMFLSFCVSPAGLSFKFWLSIYGQLVSVSRSEISPVIVLEFDHGVRLRWRGLLAEQELLQHIVFLELVFLGLELLDPLLERGDRFLAVYGLRHQARLELILNY